MPTPILNRAAQVAIETEATAGTAETLVAADCVFRVSDPTFNVAADVHEQDLLSADLSELPDLIGNEPVDITFSTLIAGSGTAATAAGWAQLLLHGGFAESVTTDVQYDPETPAGTNPATIGLWRAAASGSSGRLLVAKGCRPSQLSFEFSPGMPVRLSTTWRGAFSSAADASAFSSPSYDATVPQVFKSAGLTIGAWSPFIKGLSLDLNIGLAQIDNPGAASEPSGISHFEITSRRYDGTIDFLEVLVSDKDWLSDLRNGTEAALALAIGASAGNIVEFDAPKFQLLPSSQGDAEGLVQNSAGFKLNRSSGNDELKITTK